MSSGSRRGIIYNIQTALRTYCHTQSDIYPINQTQQLIYMPAKLACRHSHLCRLERSSDRVKVVLAKGEAKQMRL